MRALAAALLALFICNPAVAAVSERAVDLPTRAGVTQRFLLIAPDNPPAVLVLFPGGDGVIGISPDGRIERKGNFLVRSRALFVEHQLAVAVLDAPSDRQSGMNGFRQTADHLRDVTEVIAWLRKEFHRPVWLVGTSRGTQSAAYAAAQLAGDPAGPDGLVLTSSILNDPRGRPVPDMALDKITTPVLVVHHELDQCARCPFGEVPRLMDKLGAARRKALQSYRGGITRGDPCEAQAYHGYNGIENDVVANIAAWVTAGP